MSKKNRRPIGIDLFAGAGGMSLGFEQAGFDIAASLDIDPIHCAVHKFNFPLSETICGDICTLSGDEIRRRADLHDADVDVVFGGAPCQGFSMIGKRALDDPRNKLAFHFVRIVDEIGPQYCVFENVKGLTVGKHAALLQELIEEFGRIGYDVLLPYSILDASKYGVPQKRLRLFLIAARKDRTMPSYPTATANRVTVAEAIGDLPDIDDFDALLSDDSVRVEWDTESCYARILRGLDKDANDYSYARSFDSNVLTSSMRTVHTELSKERFASTPAGKTEPVSRFLKLASDGFCNTLRAGTDSARGAHTSPRPIHPVYSRVISVREAARLHSYPDWFRFHKTKWHGFRQIGNSVPPLLARAVASEIVHALEIEPKKPRKNIRLNDERLLSFDMSEACAFFGVPHNVIAPRMRKNEDGEYGRREECA